MSSRRYMGTPLVSPTTRGESTLFSFDDVSIPFTRNLRMTMHPPRKHPGNPLVRRGPPGAPDSFGVQFYGSIVRHEGKFKLWYVAVDEELNRHSGSVTCWRPAYAESRDGIHWEKPNLGLVEYKGDRDNNLVLMEPAPLGTINLKVLVEPEDPDPNRRYKMIAHTCVVEGKKKGQSTLCPLFSADGVRWRLGVDAVPVNGLLPKEKMVIPPHHFEGAGGLYKWQGLYSAAGQGGRGTLAHSGRPIVTYRSPDLIHWSETLHVSFLREGQHEAFPEGEGEETHEGVSVWHRGNVLLGLYGLWHGAPEWKDRTLDLGFLISNDGIHFREPVTDLVYLRRGEDGEWDQGGLIQGHGFENVGDKTYLWYGAWDLRVGLSFVPRGGVGLATLDRDRLGSLSVLDPAGPASFVTSALNNHLPATLWINADGLSADARLRVELLDALERPLPGYSGGEAAIVEQSALRTPISWGGEERIADLGTAFKINVTFEGRRRQDIRVYALYLGG